MSKSMKLHKTQKIARVLLLVVALISVILRIRKMIHLSMIGEEPVGFDWYMLSMWLILIVLITWTLIRQKSKRPESSAH